MKRFWGFVLFLAAGAAAAFFIYCILWQDKAIRRFVPVDAQILSATVEAHRSRRSTSYTPRISYRYTYQGQTYEGRRIVAFEESGSSSWAHKIVNQFTGNVSAKAFVNPDAPAEAILVREFSFTPYLLAMIALLGAAAGVGLVTGTLAGGRTEMKAIAFDDSGYQLLMPARTLRQKANDALMGFFGAAFATGPALVHWYLATGRTDVGPKVVTVAAGILMVISLGMFFVRWSVARYLSDARLRVKPAPMVRGQVFALDLEADAYSPVRVRAATAQVMCIEHYKERRGTKTYTGTRTLGEQTVKLSDAVAVPAGQVLSGKGELFYEAHSLRPSTDLSFKAYPYYTWEIRLKVELEGLADYRATFPLEVE